MTDEMRAALAAAAADDVAQALVDDVAQALADDVAQALVEEVLEVADGLPQEWAGRALERAEKSVALVGCRVRGEIDDAQFADLREDLKLWALAELSIAGAQAAARRRALIENTLPILFRLLGNVLTGRGLV